MDRMLCWLGWHRHDQHATYWADGAGRTEREYCASCGREFRTEHCEATSAPA